MANQTTARNGRRVPERQAFAALSDTGRAASPIVSGIAAMLCRRVRRHRQRRTLSELSDWQLRDVGLSRQEAEDEAGKPFWR